MVTTLTAAITKVLAEKGGVELQHMMKLIKLLKKKRGITISTAHVEYSTDKDTMRTLIARSRDYVKNMIMQFQMDGGILVVNAADGPMPQTREHILLLDRLVFLLLLFI